MENMFRCVNIVLTIPLKRVLVISRAKSTYRKLEKNELWKIMQEMPREKPHQREARISFQNRQKNATKYQSHNHVRLEVIGSGAHGAPRSVHLFTNNARYLFNCGEGTQRLATEYKIKLTRTPNVFITYPSWQNISGLIGMALSCQNTGIPELHIHGSQCIETMFSVTTKFVALRHLTIIMESFNPQKEFDDGILKVKYVPLYPQQMNITKNFSDSKLQIHEEKEKDGKRESSVDDGNDSHDDDVDYYDYSQMNKKRDSRQKSKKCEKKKRSHSVECSKDKSSEDKFALSYICQTRATLGTLLLEKCIEFGVPCGPLLGKLKAGEDVQLENGEIVKSSSVKSPDVPGAIIIFVECPSEDYLDSLLKEPAFYRHQSGVTGHEEKASVVVHFSSSHIVNNSKYKQWIDRFDKQTKHVFINDENMTLGSLGVHRLQHKLNLLHPDVFPLLHDDGTPNLSLESYSTPPHGHTIVHTEENDTCDITEILEEAEKELGCSKTYYKCTSNNLIRGKTLCEVYLRPVRNYDYSQGLYLKKELFLKEVFSIPGFEEALEKLRHELKLMEPNIQSEKQIYPKILFLGTGSSQPSKVRNTSGILIFLDEEKFMIFDCGEGTYGQMVRFFGKDRAQQVLRNTVAIYVSHLHADHHLGLINLLTQRRLAFQESNQTDASPVFLLAPVQLTRWLQLYSNEFDNISDLFVLIPNAYLAKNLYGTEARNECLKTANLKMIKTAHVDHCPNAFGIAITHNDGWKLTYSGDTRPCSKLVEIGKDSDVLIHEATMDCSMAAEARIKLHSTTADAIRIGKEMKAKFILLTHFSQRYSYIPLFNEHFTEEVGVAFDNMMVSLNQLPMLPKMKDILKLMFTEHYEKMENIKKLSETRKRKFNSQFLDGQMQKQMKV